MAKPLPPFYIVLTPEGDAVAGEESDEHLDELKALADAWHGSVVLSAGDGKIEVIHPKPAVAATTEPINKENEQ